MTAPPHRQHAGASTPILPWVITALFGAFLLASGAVWLAAQVAAQPDWPVPDPGDIPLRLRSDGLTALIGPHGSRARLWIVCAAQGLLIVAAGVAIGLGVALRSRTTDGRKQLTDPRGFTELQQKEMTSRAQGLSPWLAQQQRKQIEPKFIGAHLGTIRGTALYKSLEDVELMVCGPRSNKTSAKVVPDILSAPGPAVVTSIKPDVWVLTAGLRSQVGPVYLFDPQQRLTYQPQTWWFDLLSVVTDVESAARLASYFMREVGASPTGDTGRADPFFTPAASKTLRQLLLAAASSGCTFRDVMLWVATRSEEPATHLERAGYATQAAALRSTLELPVETRGGIYEGVATALSCLDSERLMRWVTPPSTWETPPVGEVSELNLWELITPPGAPHPTVYLLSREGEGSGRPIVAALIGELLEVAVQAATAQGGRLDPVLTLQLDEAANIVRLPELPQWMSWFGSMGLAVTVILQSREQGRGVWTRTGLDALWSAATIKTIGAGVQDPDFCADLSRLVGDHKVPEISTSYSPGGHSTSRSLRTEPILMAAEIAALDRRNALLFTAGRRPGLLTLHPWYEEHDLDIVYYARQATAEIQRAAIAHLGPNNPVAAFLRDQHPDLPTDPGVDDYLAHATSETADE